MRDNLQRLNLGPQPLPEKMPPPSADMARHARMVGVGERGTPADAALAKSLIKPSTGGNACDVCGTKRSAAAPLKTCSRCKRVWYCGADCQKKAWPQHKPQCRPHGTFAVGDYVVAHGLTGVQAEMNDHVLQIVRADPDPTMWHLDMIGGTGLTQRVPAANMTHARRPTT